MKRMVLDRRPSGGLAALALAAFALAATVLTLAAPADARTRHTARDRAEPASVVVEVYTAQGCDTCPQANSLIDALAKRPDVLPLTFSVDYWDYLGWPDTFAKPEFTARQQDLDRKLKVRELYTPEAVVQGRAETSALDTDKVDALIEAQQARKPEPEPAPDVRLLRHGARLTIARGRAPDQAAEVWLVRYDPLSRAVKVKAGDNKGKTVMVRNAVRDLVRLGVWTGRETRYAVPAPSAPGLRDLVLVQAPRGGRILAAFPLKS